MAKKRTTRVYSRTRNGVTRYYLDLRSLGGTQEALVAPGDRFPSDQRWIQRASWPTCLGSASSGYSRGKES